VRFCETARVNIKLVAQVEAEVHLLYVVVMGAAGSIGHPLKRCMSPETSDNLELRCSTSQAAQPKNGLTGKRTSGIHHACENHGSLKKQLESLTKKLFALQDLNGNGLLEELEVIKLNQKIAMLHYGADADVSDVKKKYEFHFRDKLNPDGDPVPYSTFRNYMQGVLDSLDNDPSAQELILEQFIAEAQAGRQAFSVPSLITESDLPYMPTLPNSRMSEASVGPGQEVISKSDTWRPSDGLNFLFQGCSVCWSAPQVDAQRCDKLATKERHVFRAGVRV